MDERTVRSFEALNRRETPTDALTPRQLRKVRSLTRAALADRGIEAAIYADHLKTLDGRTFGLHNLISKCRTSGLPVELWDEVVRLHFDALLDAFPDGADPGVVPADELEANTFVRLQVEEALPRDWHPHYRYVRRIGGGLIELLAHRRDDMVRWLRDEDLEPHGAERLREVGLANVRAVEPDEHVIVEEGKLRFHVVRGESGFIASKLLVLPDLLADVLGRRSWPEGVAVAVPSRYEIAFAPVGPGILGGTAGLWSYAAWACAHRAGPLSPYLYWWRDGRVTQLSYFGPDGNGHLYPNPAYEALVERYDPDGITGAA